MTCTLHVAWDERLVGYDFGPGHPMAPTRLKLTMELARAFGLGHLDGVVIEVPAAATDAELELIHDQAYVSLVRLAGNPQLLATAGPAKQDLIERMLLRHGLGTDDDPVFPRNARGGGHGDRGHAGRGPGRLEVGGAARGKRSGGLHHATTGTRVTQVPVTRDLVL